ncbi:MAG TPA: methylenetetrahydrofolate reductase, partial [Arachnia sp.]|nr:methylenetetrahydrofolate reductase [Arachnia sp.]
MPVTETSLRSVGELIRSAHGPLYSFEFFPPRSEEEEPVLWAAVEALAPLEPSFVSVTYGANGSRRDRTIRATRRIAASGGPLTVGHLTCVA